MFNRQNKATTSTDWNGISFQTDLECIGYKYKDRHLQLCKGIWTLYQTRDHADIQNYRRWQGFELFILKSLAKIHVLEVFSFRTCSQISKISVVECSCSFKITIHSYLCFFKPEWFKFRHFFALAYGVTYLILTEFATSVEPALSWKWSSDNRSCHLWRLS